jgi:hypothetical protein
MRREYACGTCGSRGLRIIAKRMSSGFMIYCDNFHQLTPVPGEEVYVTAKKKSGKPGRSPEHVLP